MKEGLRQSMAWLHTWSGLVVGWILFAVFVTGTASYFRHEISQWMRPELFSQHSKMTSAAGVAMGELERRAPTASRWFVTLPTEREPTLRISWSEREDAKGRRRFESALLDPTTGQEINARDTLAGEFFYRFHFQLNMPPRWGRWIVGVCAMFMLVAIVSGIITHKKIFKEFFTFRPNRGQRSWLDAHNALGVLALPYHLMITYTGLVTLMFMYMPWGIHAAYAGDRKAFSAEAQMSAPETIASGERVALTSIQPLIDAAQRHWQNGRAETIVVQHPGDANATIEIQRDAQRRLSNSAQPVVFNGVTGAVMAAAHSEPPAAATYGVLYGLHMARFSFPPLRWLFFICGLGGCAMVASGLVLWTVKRAPSQLKSGRAAFGQRLVESLNIGTIAGLPIAIAAFFWANRLLPLDITARADLEMRYFFIAWALCYVAPLLQSARSAWQTQLTAGAMLFAALPLLNALTTQTYLVASIAQGRWAYAGFDMSMLALGGVLGYCAWKVARRASSPIKPRRERIPTPPTAEAERA